MRKILIAVAIVIVVVVALMAAWVFGGRQISLLVDRFSTTQTASNPINSLVYEGSGTGGILHINDLVLSLNNRNGPAPNIGTTKNGELALADGGKVFAFGRPRSEAESLATAPAAGDDAFIEVRRSILSWPTPFDFNFMTGRSPSWRRHLYYRVVWKKPGGQQLEMLWRYEQYFYADSGWGGGTMVRGDSTGLIRVDIKG
jgi:hypothetical protein